MGKERRLEREETEKWTWEMKKKNRNHRSFKTGCKGKLKLLLDLNWHPGIFLRLLCRCCMWELIFESVVPDIFGDFSFSPVRKCPSETIAGNWVIKSESELMRFLTRYWRETEKINISGWRHRQRCKLEKDDEIQADVHVKCIRHVLPPASSSRCLNASDIFFFLSHLIETISCCMRPKSLHMRKANS